MKVSSKHWMASRRSDDPLSRNTWHGTAPDSGRRDGPEAESGRGVTTAPPTGRTNAAAKPLRRVKAPARHKAALDAPGGLSAATPCACRRHHRSRLFSPRLWRIITKAHDITLCSRVQPGAEPIEQHGGWPYGFQANPPFRWAYRGGGVRFIVIALPFVHAVLVAKPEPKYSRNRSVEMNLEKSAHGS